MITDPRYTAFINSFRTENTEFLRQIEEQAKRDGIPIIRREMQDFLKVLLLQAAPARILEIGTATGFSALFMAEYAPEPVRIDTIENYEKRIPIARENIKKAGRSETVTLFEGDAADILPTLSGPYDFIFMDAAKGQYPIFLDEVLRLLTPGGILLADNVLQDGDIIESRFAVRRRDRTIHKRMREYLYRLTHTEGLQTAILPVGDGITVSCKAAESQDLS